MITDPPDAALKLTMTEYDQRIAELGAEQVRLQREAADLRAAFHHEAAAMRAPLHEEIAAARFDQERHRAAQAELRDREQSIAEAQRAMEMQCADLGLRASQLGTIKNRVATERAAIARLDAWDLLCATTRAANAAIAALNAAPPQDQPALLAPALEAMRARREAWLCWNLQFGGTEAPELLMSPVLAILQS